MDKKYSKTAVKDVLYGTINELTNSRRFYWRGISSDYSHLTDEGKEQLIIALERIIPLIHESQDEESQQRSRDKTFDILKDGEK